MSIVGIDIGGTFTDLVGYQQGAIVASKCSTVPADPTAGAAQALRIAGCDVAALDELLHARPSPSIRCWRRAAPRPR